MRCRTLFVLISLLLSVGTVQAQRSATRRSTVPPSSSTQPTTPQTILAGKVVMDDGSALPGPVAIVSVCGGINHREAMAMLNGSFSFVMGDRRNSVLPDASDADRSNDPFSRAGAATGFPGSAQSPSRSMFGCELRAELAGYESSYISLNRETTGDYDVGTLVLHSRKGHSKESVVSATTLSAPSAARKDFDKGRSNLEKGKLPDAESSFQKAVEQYPKYAEAWFFLGTVRMLQQNQAGAREAFEQSVNADPGYPPPYLRLSHLSAAEHKWEETRAYTDRMLALDPHNVMALYYNAAALYNLKHLPQAEASALKAAGLDPQHHEPRIEVLLGLIYMGQQNYAGAAQHYRAYLQLVPEGPNIEQVKTNLAKCEEMAKATTVPESSPKP